MGFQDPGGESIHLSSAPSYHIGLAHSPNQQQVRQGYGQQLTGMYGSESSVYLQQAQAPGLMSHVVSAHAQPAAFQHAVHAPILSHLQSSARMYSVEPLDDPMSPYRMQQPSPIPGHHAVHQHHPSLQMNGQHHQQQYPTNPAGSMAQMPHEHGHAAALGPNPAFYPAVPLSAGQQAVVMGSPAAGHSHLQSTQHPPMPSYSLTQGRGTAYQHPGTSHQIHAHAYSTSSFQQNGPTAPGTDSSATIYQAQPSQPHPMATQHHLYPHFQSISSNAYMGTASQPTQTGQVSFLMGQAAASASSHSFRAAPLSRYDSAREQPSSMPGVSTGAAGSGPTGDTISVKRQRASSNASALLKNATVSARRDRNAEQLTSGSVSSPEDANKLSPDGERGALTSGASSRTKGGVDKKTGDGITTITIFQCRGFEGCNMTFSCSEHLARHVRNEAMMQELVVLHANLAASAAQMPHAHMQVSNKTVTADEREAKEAGERRQGGLRSETQPGSELTSMDAGHASQPPAGPDAATRRVLELYAQRRLSMLEPLRLECGVRIRPSLLPAEKFPFVLV
ncbi:Up in starvation [Tilletia horrida]|nr:Up in starvation [Tilletia horrida]